MCPTFAQAVPVFRYAAKGGTVNLTHLEYLVMAVSCRSYAEAGRRLHITPQAISKAILSLERELGVPLFTKDAKGVSPTPLAHEIALRAEQVLNDLSDLRSYASAHRERAVHSGVLSLGIAGSYYRGSILSIEDFGPFMAMYPDIDLRLHIQTSPFCHTGLTEGLFSAAFTFGKPSMTESLETIRLMSPTLTIVVGHRHPLTQRSHTDEVSLVELARSPIAYPVDMATVYPALCKAASAVGTCLHFVDVDPTPQAMEEFFEEGGAMFVARGARILSMLPSTVQKRLSRKPGVSIPVYLSYMSNRAPACIGSLEDYLVDYVSRLSA